jgi:hypothetical protein
MRKNLQHPDLPTFKERAEKEKQPNWKIVTGYTIIEDPKTGQKSIVFHTETLTLKEVLEILENGELEYIGRIEEALPDIAGHQNLVSFYLVVIKKKGKKVYAVFKPFLGEGWGEVYEYIFKITREEGLLQSIEKKIQPGKVGLFENIAYYPREIFAFLLSEFLNWNLVPPTVLRVIKGKYPVYGPDYKKLEEVRFKETESPGALQLFLDYATGRQYFEKTGSEPIIKLIEENPELFFKCAIFDFLLYIMYRHRDDYLVKQQGGRLDIKLIDHGNSMSFEIEQTYGLMRSIFLNLFGLLNTVGKILEIYGSYEEFKEHPFRYKYNITPARFRNIKRLKEILTEKPDWFKGIIRDLTNLKNNREELENKIKQSGLWGVTEYNGYKVQLITDEDLKSFWQRVDLLLEYLPQGIIPVRYTEEGLEIFRY